jgi:hypothetical protein
MRRMTVPLLIALLLAVLASAADARPQRYPGTVAPSLLQQAGTPVQIPVATTSNDGPSWTVAILGGAVVMVAFAGAGVLAGRASVRPQIR